ncbi:MAG TPA: LUD domain-containing protein [Aggregatilineales bacterium]|nr:LUD domain-containing protein [Aggregatilineales bacterium]
MSEALIKENWTQLADHVSLDATIQALAANGFNPLLVGSAAEAKQKVLEMLPEGIDVFAARSATLEAMGLADEIDKSGRYISIRQKLMSLNRETQSFEFRQVSATPSYMVGSVHAVTEQGHVFVASFGGSQLAPYVYGAQKVIWVIGTHKLVKDTDAAFRRIEEHSLPLESERLQKAVGRPSEIAKILIFRKEVVANRITTILVPEVLGF